MGLPEQEDVFAVEHLSRLCDGLAQQRPNNLCDLLNTLALIAPLLNAIPNVVFFIKDAQARYLLANLTLARRCGFKTVTPLLGKTSADVFPAQLGSGYTEQDLRVLRHGVLIQDQLEMHLYNGRETGWCLTQKLALYDAQGKIIGMAGISHDLQEARAHHPAYQRLAAIDVHIRRHYARPIARGADGADRLVGGADRTLLQAYLPPHPAPDDPQSAVGKATELLAGDLPITDIALLCGYTDHSAFSRQFKAMTGSTPRDFRLTLSA